ncbi:Cytosolic purine 5'-nucleotidase [Cichlidogyrus casuarinus]|uniref:Cytosolic purine 5'-nucleotidase n=1 Tax=Cichlidogyrus casuarinus TaxID=1844966 RepID=A0ABD2QNQ9_9PLAT
MDDQNKTKVHETQSNIGYKQYKSPHYEELAFSILQAKLIEMGYPEDLNKFKYEPSFPVRGMWFDKTFGTLLKMDQFGNILVCLLGFKIVVHDQLRHLYPNKFVKYDEKRIVIMNTLFDLPKLYMLACIIQLLTDSEGFIVSERGVKRGALYMSYMSVYEDVEKATDWMHTGELKRRTLADIDRYVYKDSRIPLLLERLRSYGAKTFLLTNSDYDYSHSSDKTWKSYFDYIVTDANKPKFFIQGTILRSVNESTGQKNIGHHMGPLESGRIYSGGSCEVFSELIGARGKDVLYVGDHIFGDILKSKKTVGWRTFLIIPELVNEIYVWKTKSDLFEKLNDLNRTLASYYKNMNITSSNKPDVSQIQTDVRRVAQEMEESYGILGSIFRNGSRQTFFSSQVLRYADLYSFSCVNLTNYPLFYMFRAPQMLMPHESTVSHDDTPLDSYHDLDATPCSLQRRTRTGMQLQPSIDAWTPSLGPPRSNESSDLEDDDIY